MDKFNEYLCKAETEGCCIIPIEYALLISLLTRRPGIKVEPSMSLYSIPEMGKTTITIAKDHYTTSYNIFNCGIGTIIASESRVNTITKQGMQIFENILF